MKKIFKSRFSLLYSLILTYIVISFCIRFALYIASIDNFDFSLIAMFKIFGLGLFFDISVALFFSTIYSLYLLFLPSRFIGRFIDRTITYFLVILLLFIIVFSFLAEFPFWQEFNTRFNFIAVDYLIYTYEVVENINQSYPIPLIIVFLFAIIFITLFIYKKKKILRSTFQQKPRFRKRFVNVVPLLAITVTLAFLAKNKRAEWSINNYENELSKNGVFSFFSAMNSNQLDYNTFYQTIAKRQAYKVLKNDLLQGNQSFVNQDFDNIARNVSGNAEQRPNIVLIAIESLSADFLKRFGNQENLTPNYEALAQNSIFFTNLYATGTRTVRGMEALTLCVPPTPGNSIVRRPDNDSLFSIATILKQKNYDLSFIYGGDGYFDNMNTFFGGQGFNIVDRNRGNPLSDDIKTKRFEISDNEVTFENAWGICDEDSYSQSLKYADRLSQKNKPFFQFIMTTSNHKPYTFPNGKINMAQGTRESAIKYTDYALGEYIRKARTKPWFKNTVFVIVADHCASSAGRWEINIENHHIPGMIYNLKNQKGEIGKVVSQIDIMPTLFGYLKWNYETELYGKDINRMARNEERAFLGNYRTLGMLKSNYFIEINDRKKINNYTWNHDKKLMKKVKVKDLEVLEKLTISYYQIASERFKNGSMKQSD